MGLVQHYPAVSAVPDPVCSVCVANYNGTSMLADCLDSVLAQYGAASIEIIVHDDASTDDSVAFLRKHYPQVEVLAGTENVGFCVSNNRMVAHARGAYVLLLNNDAALYPDAISTFLDAARKQTAADILTLPQYDWTTGELVDRGCLLDPFYNPIPNLDPRRGDVAVAIGACLWISRDLWNELGGFPVWMESLAEDLYLCCLARSRGKSVRCLLQSGFRHRLGSSFGGARVANKTLNTSFRRRRLSEQNKTFALFIFTPTPAMWILLAVHLLSLLVEGAILSTVRLDYRIFGRIYANVPAALVRKRKIILLMRGEVRDARSATARSYFSCFSPLPRKAVLLLRFGFPTIKK